MICHILTDVALHFMKTYPIKSLFQGCAAIRNNICDEAIKAGGIIIVCDGEKMTLTPEDMRDKIKFRSKKPVKDKFSDKEHILLYYQWKAD